MSFEEMTVTGKTWTGAAKIAFAAAALGVAILPASQLLAQQPAASSAQAPAAAAPAPAADAPVDQGRVAKGRDLFTNWGCTSCHALADAGSHGDVGPHLDNGSLTEPYIISRVTNGQGAMPSFAGQLTDKEIADLAYYIVHVAKK